MAVWKLLIALAVLMKAHSAIGQGDDKTLYTCA